MEQAFERVLRSVPLQGKKVLVAVSTGIDSMVLLTLLEKFSEKFAFTLGVVHINHNLRQASGTEAAFLNGYCEQNNLPYFTKTWQQPATVNVEKAARDFRYAFFRQVMEEACYDYLVTAHHADDQAETMLMRLTRGGSLVSHAGILPLTNFANGKLWRPLLSFSKDTLTDYARKNQLNYFEDVTNASDDYLRNRLRHHVVPQLKKENPQVLNQFNAFSQALVEQSALVAELLEQEVASLKKIALAEFQLPLSRLLGASRPKLMAVLTLVEKKIQEQAANFHLSQKQKEKVLELLLNEKSQWQIDLESDWQVLRRYEILQIRKKSTITIEPSPLNSLKLNQGQWLNEQQWVGIFTEAATIPNLTANFTEVRFPLFLAASDFPLQLRKRQAGDKIQLSAKLSKKVSRYFIDQKVPKEFREESFILTTEKKEIIGLLPFVVSYLRKGCQTDRIQYVLLFRYQTHTQEDSKC